LVQLEEPSITGISNPEIRGQTPAVFPHTAPFGLIGFITAALFGFTRPQRKGGSSTNNANKQTKQQAELCTARNIW